MGPADVLARKLMFKKGTLPAKKLEEMGPVIKELKCAREGRGEGGLAGGGAQRHACLQRRAH